MKNFIHNIGFLGCLLFINSACKKQNDYLPPAFNYAIPEVKIKENVNVGCFYYAYSPADWAKKYTNTPLLGEYDSLDPSVMTKQEEWANSAGIDFFIFKWNGAATGDPLINSFIKANDGKLKMAINYNTAHLQPTNASPLTGAKLATMVDEFKSFAELYFTQDYYFKINGRPVVVISPVNLASGAASSIDYTAVIPALKKELASIGISVYLVGEITTGWLPPVRYSSTVKVVDGIVLSDWSTDVYDRAAFIPSFTDINWKTWTDSTAVWKNDFIPCIFPAYDDKTQIPTSKLYNINRSNKFYQDYCNVAKRNMSNNRLVFLNSWNNFQQGTTIEPTQEYSTTYLDLTHSEFKIK